MPASSRTSRSITALRNVFDGEYAAATGPTANSPPPADCRVSDPTPLDTLTIRGEGARRSIGSIAFVTRMTPKTLVSSTVRMLSISTRVGSCGITPVIPALLTSTSRPPTYSSTSAAAAATLSSDVTSSGTPNASTPLARSLATASLRRSSSRAPTPTRKPCAPRPSAIANPMPLLAPVMSTVFF